MRSRLDVYKSMLEEERLARKQAEHDLGAWKERYKGLEARFNEAQDQVLGYEEGARQVSILLDAVLAELAFSHGDPQADGSYVLTLPMDAIMNRDLRVVTSESDPEKGLYIVRMHRKEIKGGDDQV